MVEFVSKSSGVLNSVLSEPKRSQPASFSIAIHQVELPHLFYAVLKTTRILAKDVVNFCRTQGSTG